MPDQQPLRALSVRQPWADAIVYLGKHVENRSRRTHYRGPVAIHAAKALVPDPDAALDLIARITRRARADLALPGRRGAIIAVATIVGCHQHTDPRHPCDHAGAPMCSTWAMPGQWHWELANIRPLPQPVPVPRGRLGLWHLDDDTDAAVRAQLDQREVPARELL